MKLINPITLILAALLAAPMAQTPPQAISYQALVRDGAGAAVRNQAVGVRIRLHQDSANAAISYAESFTPTTNNFGNVNLGIGRGSVISGTFSTLDWSRPMYVEIGVDPNGGTAYVDLGTSQLLSVPYALYSGRSGSSVSNPVQNEIRDADGNTRVSTERSPNENIIRFDLNGTEKIRLQGSTLGFVNTGSSVFIGDSAGVNTALTNRVSTFVGHAAGYSNTTAAGNTFIGNRAGFANTTGSYNVFVGDRTGISNVTGTLNTMVGDQAGYLNVAGSSNTFVGYAAGLITTSSDNSYFGSGSGSNNTTGNYNTFSGASSGILNTTGSGNTFAGHRAGYSNTTGGYNTFTGANVGYYNTTGYSNTFTGAGAGYANTTGFSNTFVGQNTGYYNTTGYGNVFIGNAAGQISINDSSKLYINNDFGVPLIWGNFATDSVRINGGLSVARSVTAVSFVNSSDRRLKENIQPVSNALDGVGKINGVYYTYKSKAPDGNPYPQSRQIGVIAQDVEKVYPELVATQPGGYKAVDYPKLTAVLIEAVKEQQKIIEGQKTAISNLETANREMAAWKEKVEAALRLSQVERDVAKVAKR